MGHQGIADAGPLSRRSTFFQGPSRAILQQLGQPELDLGIDGVLGGGDGPPLTDHDTDRLQTLDLKRYQTDTVGLPTLRDILTELKKPGRDPREQFQYATFREDVQTIEDLTEGMTLEGVVTNVTNFGAFVDIGVHRDGLVHVSQLADRYVRDPHEVVKVGQVVTVRVMEVDTGRGRISLSMRAEPGTRPQSTPRPKKASRPSYTVDDLKKKYNRR